MLKYTQTFNLKKKKKAAKTQLQLQHHSPLEKFADAKNNSAESLAHRAPG